MTTVTWENEVISIVPTFNDAAAGVTSAGVKKIVLDQTKTAQIAINNANGIIKAWTTDPATPLADLANAPEVTCTIDGVTVEKLDPLSHDGKTLVVDVVWKVDGEETVAAELSLSILISVE